MESSCLSHELQNPKNTFRVLSSITAESYYNFFRQYLSHASFQLIEEVSWSC